MAKLSECNPTDCHRGIEMGTVTDEDGYNHHQVRVACNHCGVVGPWHVDDSLTRAISDWNANHVTRGAEVLAQRKAEQDAAAAEQRQQHIAAMERGLSTFGPEITLAELQASTLRGAGKGREADFFQAKADQLKKDRQELEANLAALKVA